MAKAKRNIEPLVVLNWHHENGAVTIHRGTVAIDVLPSEILKLIEDLRPYAKETK